MRNTIQPDCLNQLVAVHDIPPDVEMDHMNLVLSANRNTSLGKSFT